MVWPFFFLLERERQRESQAASTPSAWVWRGPWLHNPEFTTSIKIKSQMLTWLSHSGVPFNWSTIFFKIVFIYLTEGQRERVHKQGELQEEGTQRQTLQWLSHPGAPRLSILEWDLVVLGHLGGSVVEFAFQLRAWSQSSEIESHIRLPARSLFLPLPMSLPSLCVSHE